MFKFSMYCMLEQYFTLDFNFNYIQNTIHTAHKKITSTLQKCFYVAENVSKFSIYFVYCYIFEYM